MWVGTTDGLDQFDRSQNRFIHYRYDRNDVKSLSNNMILALYEDRAGLVWVGTQAGLSRFDETASQFALYHCRPDSAYRLSDDSILAVCEDRSGDLWVGTAEGGLNRLDRDAGTVTIYRHDAADPASLSSDGVTALYEDRAGSLWVGTDNRWLERFDPETEMFVHVWYLSAGVPQVIIEDRAGDLWIGTSNGLYRLDRTAGTTTHYRVTADPALSNNRVTTLYELQDGRLLVGTDGGGVNVWDPMTEQFGYYQHDPDEPNSLAHNSVYAFYEAPDEGLVWIGTWRGLDSVERAEGTVRHYTEEDGLPGGAVFGIMADATGMLWLITNRELARFDPRAETFRTYDTRDGLPSGRFVQTAIFQSEGGEILIGSSEGLVAFHPDRLPENRQPPPVVITALGLFNEVIRRDLPPDASIELSYRQNFLSFEFAALDYIAPEKNQYAYRLEGVDADWVQAGTRRQADYPNLRPGSYLFRVRASNNAGVWNEEGAAARITITPPPWDTWWFRGIVLLLVVAAVVRQKPVDVLVMWLIMAGIALGWGVAIALSFVVLFPLLILFIALGGVAGALPAYLVFLLSGLVFEGAVPVLLAIAVGLPVFILVMLAPWWCLGGLMKVFESSAWTLTYRELRVAGEAEPARVRTVDAKDAGALPAT